MVVKGQVDIRAVGQVCGDVPGTEPDFAVLHIFGMHKHDLVDHVQFFEQHGADKAVEIAPGNQSVYRSSHTCPPKCDVLQCVKKARITRARLHSCSGRRRFPACWVRGLKEFTSSRTAFQSESALMTNTGAGQPAYTSLYSTSGMLPTVFHVRGPARFAGFSCEKSGQARRTGF